MLTVDVSTLETLARGWREAPQYTQQVLEAAMDTAVRAVRDAVVDKTMDEHNASGQTRESIFDEMHATPAGVLGVVGSASPVARFLELGTKPHKHPFERRHKSFVGPLPKSRRLEAVEQWVGQKLNITEEKARRRVAFAVLRKIARDGMAPKRPFARALEMAQPQIAQAFEDAAGQIADYLAGGAA